MIRKKSLVVWLLMVLLVAGCNDDDDSSDNNTAQNPPPDFVRGTIVVSEYDGVTDDLATAGYGQSGILTADPPVADPENPTLAEVRRKYIAWVYSLAYDPRPASGWGTLYGPAVPTRYAVPDNDGKVAGREYLAYADDGNGEKNVTMRVKVPDHFDPQHPCIIAAPVGGHLNANDLPVADWGMKKGCAVAHTDKGGGDNIHALSNGIVVGFGTIPGTLAEIGNDAGFVATGTEALSVAEYSTQYPNRVAIKYPHSRRNPEAGWGYDTLQALEFAFYVVNRPEHNPDNRAITPENTVVMAVGLSNGGGSVLRAVEQDTQGLIDGAVAIEPNVNPRKLSQAADFTIRQGEEEFPPAVHGRSTLDYMSYQKLYQSCASADTVVNMGAEIPAGAPGRCAALYNAGLLNSRALAGQIAESQSLLNRYGFLPSGNNIAHLYNVLFTQIDVANMVNSYGRFSVVENVCDYSYAYSVDSGSPLEKNLAALREDVISPPLSLNLITNRANDGMGQNYLYHVDADGNVDQDLAGALCLRQLMTGTTGITADSGTALSGERREQSERVRQGLAEITASGDLQGKPVIIVHGRDDALIPVNFSSRSYYGLNRTTEGAESQLTYIEVKNAAHLDSLGPLIGNTQVPLLVYLNEALDRMYAHLTEGEALPVSQVIPAVPLAQSGGTALTREVNLPYIDSFSACPITFTDRILEVPEC